MNYYNEIDPFAAEWLRQLIQARHIPAGYVDTRSIVDVRHAAATRFATAGKTLEDIGQVLGHADTKTTELYVHA